MNNFEGNSFQVNKADTITDLKGEAADTEQKGREREHLVPPDKSAPSVGTGGPPRPNVCPEAQPVHVAVKTGTSVPDHYSSFYSEYSQPQGVRVSAPQRQSIPSAFLLDTSQNVFVVQIQPGCDQSHRPSGLLWLPEPSTSLDCPPGLERLSKIDQVLIEQQCELIEVITGFETNNRYEIKDDLGEMMYFAMEDTDCCTRNCCGPYRPFTLRLLDTFGQEVITMKRPLRCWTWCFPCCLQEIEIQAPPGEPIGYVTQILHPCLRKFLVKNERREDVLKIIGPCILFSCFTNIDFQIKSLDEECVVGKITKLWSGLVKELCTDADNYRIQFPPGLNTKMKAVMLGLHVF